LYSKKSNHTYCVCTTFYCIILIRCTVHLLLFRTMTNSCTIISQIITLLHVSTLSCHPQGACNQDLHLKYLCNLASYWLQAPWGWHDSVETCRSVIICEMIVHLLVIVQNNKRCTTVQVLKQWMRYSLIIAALFSDI
jgi:hypothetical protein